MDPDEGAAAFDGAGFNGADTVALIGADVAEAGFPEEGFCESDATLGARAPDLCGPVDAAP